MGAATPATLLVRPDPHPPHCSHAPTPTRHTAATPRTPTLPNTFSSTTLQLRPDFPPYPTPTLPPQCSYAPISHPTQHPLFHHNAATPRFPTLPNTHSSTTMQLRPDFPPYPTPTLPPQCSYAPISHPTQHPLFHHNAATPRFPTLPNTHSSTTMQLRPDFPPYPTPTLPPHCSYAPISHPTQHPLFHHTGTCLSVRTGSGGRGLFGGAGRSPIG